MNALKRNVSLALAFLLAASVLWVMPVQAEAEIVYINPDGGRYYHSRRNCETIRSEYHPLMKAIDAGSLEDEAYSSLIRCVYCFDDHAGLPPSDGVEWVEVYYYNPDGGSYYHLRYDCETIGSEYLPVMECFTADRLHEEPFSALIRCDHCFDGSIPADQVTAFRYQSVYDTAPEGFILSASGIYTAGKDFPEGIYTITGTEACELFIFTESGDVLHQYSFPGAGTASFYFSSNMQIRLPEGCSMTGVKRETRFQSVYDKSEIISARYFVMVECPGIQYWIQAMDGKTGSVTLYNMDAETGLATPEIIPLTTEPTLLVLQNSHDTFVELRNVIIWPAENGEG